MSIGKKIRSLRIQRGMTQKELAGDEITRNMLSRIENGAAFPSMNSLFYIAERLEVSPAYFFDESEKSQNEIESELCSLYNEGEYEKCITAGSALLSEEAKNILSQCYLNLAVSDFMQRKYKSARESLLLAKEHCESSADITDTVYNIVMCLLKLRDFPFDMEMDELQSDMLPSYRSMASNFYLFLLSFADSSGDGEQISLCSLYGLHVSARAEMSKGNYGKAEEILQIARRSITGSTPSALSFMIIDDLVTCCTRTGNYREAYELERLRHETGGKR